MSRDLISVDSYKQYKNINGTTDDATIASLIPSVSEMVKNYCGRTFVDYISTDKTEYWEDGGSCIFLDEFPVISITSVNESLDNHQTQTTLTENTDFFVDTEKGIITTANGSSFEEWFHYVQIVYTGGYRKLPKDLKLACFSLVDYFRKEKFTQRKSLGANIVEELESDELPGHIKRTLDSYRISI